MDKFQRRYLKHQEYKRSTLTGELKEPGFKESKGFLDVVRNRKSRRVYKKGINSRELKEVFDIADYSPSSCARKAIDIRLLDDDLSDLLVGARDWHKKGTVIGFFAKKEAYKSEWEQGFMPFLDAGIMAQTILLFCEYKKYKACFINPNTHGKYQSEDEIFCGAIAIGK